MPIEVVCGGCQGRLLVQTPGTVVACPHCGMHLSVPAASESGAAQTDATATDDAAAAVSEGTDTVITPPPAPADEFQGAQPAQPPAARDQAAWVPPTEPLPNVTAPDSDNAPTETMSHADASGDAAASVTDTFQIPAEQVSSEDATTIAADAPPPATAQDAIPNFGVPAREPAASVSEIPQAASSDAAPSVDAPASEAATIPGQTDSLPPAESTAVPPVFINTDPIATSPPDQPSAPVEAAASAAAPSAGLGPGRTKEVPRQWFMIVASYASAVTLACIYLLLTSERPGVDASKLESLPDLRPRFDKKTKKIALRLVPEDAPMPPGHTLRIGDQQRFGNVKVTPLRVTRGSLQFVHFNDPSKKKQSNERVLKLWLRLENVSDDQEFPPLDRKLMLTRVQDKENLELLRANNFLCLQAAKGKKGQKVLVFDHPISSPWDLQGQNLGRSLKPGEQIETFIPTVADGLDQLQGDLIWRVHFRKGYNPKSFRGVTTLLEVAFDSEDITAEG